MSGRRPGRSLPCPRPQSCCGDVHPVERTSGVQASGVQASAAFRCPDGQAFGVRGAIALSAPPWAWSGSVWRAVLGLGAVGRRAAAVRGRRGRLPASGRTARAGAALAVPGLRGVDRSRGRLAGVPAAASPWPPGRHGRCPGGVPAGWRGSPVWSRCSPAPQGVLGRSSA
jgi:hypothetical protein